MPAAPKPSVAADVRGNEVVIPIGDRRWRIRGLNKNMSYELLKVNILVSLMPLSTNQEPRTTNHPPADNQSFHVDTFDLYSARQRAVFITQAATELGISEDIVKKDLGKVLLKLEELQDEQIRKALEPKDATVKLSEEERAEALALLKDPNLLSRIGNDFEACGLVGEGINRIVGYLAGVSRKLEKPLAIIIQSSSAAGKSALMEAVLAFMPEEERTQYSAMTGQSLFYMDGSSLKHKILAIAEEEGAEKASYALKLLQSEGKLSIASTGKDPTSGRLITHEYHVEGPVAILITTTAIDIDEELLNRCIVLTVDESREQTRAIHRMQRESRTLEGMAARKKRSRILKLHQNAQRLLRPLEVRNPYAQHLTFVDDATRTRRDHEKYLTLIDSIALLHQCQREVKTGVLGGEGVEYVEVTLSDIEVANRIANEVLGRSLDELPPQTRRFLELVYQMVTERRKTQNVEQCDFRFRRWDLREVTGWSYPQVRKHLDRLVEYEYVLVHGGARGQSFVYELLWDGKGSDGKPFVIGLIDVDTLAATTTLSLTPSEAKFDPSLTPL